VDEASRQRFEKLKMPDVTYVPGFNIPNYEKRDPAPQYQLPFTPREAMKFMQTPAEFTFELFASEPDIVRPIFFQFDERGRLWLIETVDYPNEILDGNAGDDRIRILEDTNGDGRADKYTVFADNLNIPTSLVFANDGVIVSQAPHMLFLKDTNGDGKADERKILSTGWGTADTHAGPSNLQYGPDNYIWGVVGYSGFKGEMNGKPTQFVQGAYRFRPDGSGFEFMTGSTNNTWGLGFSETFDVFGSTANNEPSFYMAIPNRHFEGVNGLPAVGRNVGPGYQPIQAFYQAHYITPYIRQVDVHGGYTSAAGHNLYTARAFPKEYWNRIALITEPTVHIVGQGILEKQGAGFVTRDGWNLIASTDEWFAPVHAQVGPDGAVWIADWYNFIVQHNPTPTGYSNGRGNAYETALRDDRRGRIYRIAYRNAPAAAKRSLSKKDPAGLLAALKSDNMFWRLHAQRLLVERGQKDVVPQLVALVKDSSVDAVGTNGPALHALWTLHGLGEMSGPESPGVAVAVAALKHPAAGVRKAAAMVLPKSAQASAAILDAGLLQDTDLHTRLAATLVVAEMPESPAIAQALYRESQKPENFGDRWLSRAFFIAASRHRAPFLSTYRADANAVAPDTLPIALRLGNLKPDWRTPAATEAANWKAIETPGTWEATKTLPAFDGVVWFTRTIDWPAGAEATTLSLGTIRNIGETWLNGVQLEPAGPAPPGGRRFNAIHTFDLPPGSLKAGANTLTVRVENIREDGGLTGPAEAMFVAGGATRVPLSTGWRHRVERQTNATTLYTKPGELQSHVAFAAAAGAAEAGATLAPAAPRQPDVVLRLGVLKGQLKFDRDELNVQPGQLVELVFTNIDEMPHNFLLGAPGSLERIGAAADAMTTNPNAMAQQFVPDMAEILASTRLVDPGQSQTIQFRAPTQEGQYPYVCTFPGHWRLMNGLLKVAKSARE
jgi:putative membrane-bound dehydrogenase-like protein